MKVVAFSKIDYRHLSMCLLSLHLKLKAPSQNPDAFIVHWKMHRPIKTKSLDPDTLVCKKIVKTSHTGITQ